MPNFGEKKVLPSGICTCPPSARALNTRSALGSSGTLTVSGAQAAAGPVRFTRTSATGTLGGKTFTAR